MQIFKNIGLNVKRESIIFFKCYRPIHCSFNVSSHNVYRNVICNNKALVGLFMNERKVSNAQNISSYKKIHSKIFKGSLLCNDEANLTKRIFSNSCPVNPYPITVNNVRHYSNAPPVVVNEAIAYNSGFFRLISESVPVEWITELLRFVHYGIGLPWWATIIVTTVVARMLIHLPLSILDHHNRAKQANLQGELMEFAKTIKMEARMGLHTSELSPSQAAFLCRRALAREQKDLYQRENCHPFKSVAIILLQAPVWISFSVAMRNICFMLPEQNFATRQDYLGFVNDGFGWIQNLTDIDHSFALPIIFGLSGLIIIEINDVLFNVRDTKFRKILKNFYRFVIVCFIPVTACIPSCLSLYCLTNSSCAMLQNLVLLSPKARRLVGIPKSSLEFQHPYAELSKRLTSKFHSKRSVAKA